MSLTAQLRRHRTRWLCDFGLVLLLVASLGAASENLSDLKARAEKGDAEAQYNLGAMYVTGQGVAQNFDLAHNWTSKAAEQGHANAQSQLGLMFERGDGVAQDFVKALKWYRKAAEKGNPSGEYSLGRMYYIGLGVRKDDAEALKWYRKAAEQGYTNAHLSLGSMYAEGAGVPQDYTEAVQLFLKAAEQGNAQAQNNLGWMYQNGLGVAQDYTEALNWFRKAAEQGFAIAQYSVGVMYYNGQGVAKDNAEAMKWWRKAAEQGSVQAQKILNSLKSPGKVQVKKDELDQLKIRAEQGDAIAQHNLGNMYANGKGVPKDSTEAVKQGTGEGFRLIENTSQILGCWKLIIFPEPAMKKMNKFVPYSMKYQWYCFLEGGELLSMQSNKDASHSASQVIEQVKRFPIVEEYSIPKTGIIFTYHKDAKQKMYWVSSLITRDRIFEGIELKEGDMLMTIRNWETGKDIYYRFLRKIR